MKDMKKDYILFVTLLIVSSFEFFFRSQLGFLVYCWAGIMWFCSNKGSVNIYERMYIICMILLFAFQTILLPHYKVTAFISNTVSLFGVYFIASIVHKRFVKIYVNVMYIISIISLTIYLLCLNDTLFQYLYYSIAPYFTSLNVDSAKIEGGGVNILIYNFQNDYLISSLGLRRICGPFWEPGMFAVFIIVALFFHNFLEKQKGRWINFILIFALVTTLSTGGYVAGLVLLLMKVLRKEDSAFRKVITISVFSIITYYVYDLEFMEEKIAFQMDNVTIGNDYSRFSAFLTQIKMIGSSPFLGGEPLENYLDGVSTTLASGTLLPFVVLGIPMGFFYFISLFKSCLNLASYKNKSGLVGICLAIIVIVLSFSQTILLSPMTYLLLFVGLINKNNRYNYETI